MEAVSSSMDGKNRLDTADTATTDEDVTNGNVTHPTSVIATDHVDKMRVEAEDGAEAADVTESRKVDTEDFTDVMGQAAEAELNGSECDGDSTMERTLLDAMTPAGRDYYLRLGETPRRRSALRLSRIIARRQLLQRLEQGSDRASVSLFVFTI